MDMCIIDLGNSNYEAGEEVQLFGKGNSIFEMSEVLETIPYEIISAISTRVQRVYLED
jgi:alanine racemase